MKILIILMTAFLMQVSASTFAQKITLNEKQASLVSIFEKINKQSGVDFLVNIDLLSKAKLVSINVNNEELSIVLDKIFEDQPLEYTLKDKAVVVTKKTPTFLERLADRWAAIDVRGRVVDQEGKPLPGATVKVKGTGKSVSANAKGEFYLEKVEDGAILVISFIGYVNKEVVAEKELGNIVVELSDSKLDEVQVIAYGTTTRRFSTGNVSSVKSEDIAKSPVQNPLLVLQGRVPGIYIEQATGFANSGVKVRIQGQNSLSKGNDPLYVIDGVPFSSQMLPSLLNILGSSGGGPEPTGNGNPLSFINPSDIERIDVLKDGDATAIYGSRAANGAILITTKKGKSGDTNFDFSFQSGYGTPTRKLELLNTQQYLEMRKEAFKNDGVTPSADPGSPFYAKDLTLWDQNRYTDWQKALMGGKALYTDAQMSISGGSPTTQFLTSANYKRETIVFPGNTYDEKGSIHFSLNNTSKNQRFKFGLSGGYMIDNNSLQQVDFASRTLHLQPNAPNLYNADGTLNFEPLSNGNSTFDNPLLELNNKANGKTKNLIINGNVGYELLDGLNIQSSFGYTDLQNDEVASNPVIGQLPENRPNFPRVGQYNNSNANSWIIEPRATYKRLISKGELEIMIGSTLQKNNNKRSGVTGVGYNSDLNLEDMNSAANIYNGGALLSSYKYVAVFGRMNYNWRNSYILNMTIRRDGSSRFGDNNKFNNFGSIGGAWIFSNQKIIKDHIGILSFGKLWGSYGTTGNDQIGDYQFLNLYSSVTGIGVGRGYQGVTGIQPNGLPNPLLQWEETNKLQFGLDFGVFQDRLLMNVTYFRNRSSNQLLNYALPFLTGFAGIQANFPATVQNSGLELALNTINFRQGNFKWSSGFNLTIPKNKLLKFSNLAESSYANQLVVGESITTKKYYSFAGVNTTTGLYQFNDRNGNLTSDPGYGLENRIAMINTDPIFYGGFQNSFSYGNFSLDILFQFVKQKSPDVIYFGNSMPGISQNQPINILDRWQKPGDVAPFQKYSSGQDPTVRTAHIVAMQSDYTISDGSYIRLKNISASWQMPAKWRKNVHLASAKLFIQGQNLITLTNYNGLDPETRSSYSLPPLKMLTIGLQVGL